MFSRIRGFVGFGLRSPVFSTSQLGYDYSYCFVDGSQKNNPQTDHHLFSVDRSRVRGLAWRKLTLEESRKLKRGDAVIVRMDSGECLSAQFLDTSHFGPKILFDGRSDFTLVWENMVGIYE